MYYWNTQFWAGKYYRNTQFRAGKLPRNPPSSLTEELLLQHAARLTEAHPGSGGRKLTFSRGSGIAAGQLPHGQVLPSLRSWSLTSTHSCHRHCAYSLILGQISCYLKSGITFLPFFTPSKKRPSILQLQRRSLQSFNVLFLWQY